MCRPMVLLLVAVTPLGIAPGDRATGRVPSMIQESGAAPRAGNSMPPVRAVRGVAKAIGPGWVVIARPCRAVADLRLTVPPGTPRQGDLVEGVLVSVRYRVDGTQLVATAVWVGPAPVPSPRGKPAWPSCPQ